MAVSDLGPLAPKVVGADDVVGRLQAVRRALARTAAELAALSGRMPCCGRYPISQAAALLADGVDAFLEDALLDLQFSEEESDR